MSTIHIATLKAATNEKPHLASVLAQLQSRTTRTTKNGKPYLELSFADSTGSFSLKIWSDSPLFSQAEAYPLQDVFLISGHWTQNTYGIDIKEPDFLPPAPQDLADFFAGNPDIKAKQDADLQDIRQLTSSISDPRLKALCELFFSQMGERFSRTAAAKRNHHARRGGLVEHVAQMMRSAAAISSVYSQLNRDLLLCGVLFHDCGKLWENTYPEFGFAQIHSIHGEMLGHIPLGIELVNKLWRDLLDANPNENWNSLSPSNEETRLHLLHLVASHHGEYQFGSPTLPRTPEAMALHYIDNLDAKLEMAKDAYAQSTEIAPQIFERVFPLPTHLVRPLSPFNASLITPEADA